LSAWL